MSEPAVQPGSFLTEAQRAALDAALAEKAAGGLIGVRLMPRGAAITVYSFGLARSRWDEKPADVPTKRLRLSDLCRECCTHA